MSTCGTLRSRPFFAKEGETPQNRTADARGRRGAGAPTLAFGWVDRRWASPRGRFASAAYASPGERMVRGRTVR
jgi:hypothetical protein